MNGKTKLQEINFTNLSDILKALAEPTRIRIFDLLMKGDHCNCELSDALEIAPNLVSHHLRILREAELVDVERDASDARWVYYSVNRQALEGLNAIFGMFFDPARIKPRRPTCGPQNVLYAPEVATAGE